MVFNASLTLIYLHKIKKKHISKQTNDILMYKITDFTLCMNSLRHQFKKVKFSIITSKICFGYCFLIQNSLINLLSQSWSSIFYY